MWAEITVARLAFLSKLSFQLVHTSLQQVTPSSASNQATTPTSRDQHQVVGGGGLCVLLDPPNGSLKANFSGESTALEARKQGTQTPTPLACSYCCRSAPFLDDAYIWLASTAQGGGAALEDFCLVTALVRGVRSL